jgi:hypothetical protein
MSAGNTNIIYISTSLNKWQFVVTHTISLTEITAFQNSMVKNTPPVKMLCPQKKKIACPYNFVLNCWYVGNQSCFFSVSCKILYHWLGQIAVSWTVWLVTICKCKWNQGLDVREFVHRNTTMKITNKMHYIDLFIIQSRLYMFRAMFSPIIRSTWLYLQYLVVFTQVAAGWCPQWVETAYKITNKMHYID